MPAELGYFTIAVPDLERGQVFYGTLFGWTFDSRAANANYAHVGNTNLPLGLKRGGPADLGSLYFIVDDVGASVARVRELGGEADHIQESPSGLSVVCRDDQGTAFGLWRRAPGF